MSTLGVVAALPAEGRALSGEMHVDSITTSVPGLLLGISGIGRQAADQTARRLIDQGADALVSWGCGAGLTSSATPGQLFLPLHVIDQAGHLTHQVDADWHDRLGRVLHDAGIGFETSALVSVNTMLTGLDSKQQLHHECSAGIADMESAAIAAVAAQYRRPFLCVRAVADNLSIALPAELLTALDEYGRPRSIEMLRMLLRRPLLIPHIMKLGRAFGQARRSLSAVARTTGRRLACGP